ncbi:TPA: hypothetical protein ACP30Y_005572 [Pseudomonas aeruginosa]
MIPPGAQAPCPAGARDDEATRLRRFVASVPNRISIGAARGAAPLDLLEVADLRLEDGVWFSAIVLELHGKALPAPSTRPLDPFAARAVSECRDGPRVRLLSPGWRLNGRNLSLLEAAEVIDLYLDIARAQARLRQLGEIPPSASSSLPTPRIFP